MVLCLTIQKVWCVHISSFVFQIMGVTNNLYICIFLVIFNGTHSDSCGNETRFQGGFDVLLPPHSKLGQVRLALIACDTL